MTHYDKYPYPDPGLYTPDQVRFLRNNFAPTKTTWKEWWPGEEPGAKNVLVIGCGVYEALSVAAQEPLLRVIALDSSKKTLAISQSLAREANIPNLIFIHCDFAQVTDEMIGGSLQAFGRYDLVIASGVMHHIRDDLAFVGNVRKLLLPGGGLFSVMVYGDCMRRPIADFRAVLQALDVPLDEEGIKFTRTLINALPLGHPVRDFWESVRQNDSQIVDLFLHPYARHYEVGDLIAMMRTYNFELVRWFNDAVKLPPVLAKRCANMSDTARARIAQILNHADAKLAGLFRKE